MTPEYQRILLVDDDDVTNFLSREIFRHYHPDVCIDIAQNGRSYRVVAPCIGRGGGQPAPDHPA